MTPGVGNAAFVAIIAIVPLVVLMLTSFVKISVVLSLLRNALGAPEAPSGLIVMGLSLILTFFVMVPVAIEMAHAAAQPTPSAPKPASSGASGGAAASSARSSTPGNAAASSAAAGSTPGGVAASSVAAAGATPGGAATSGATTSGATTSGATTSGATTSGATTSGATTNGAAASSAAASSAAASSATTSGAVASGAAAGGAAAGGAAPGRTGQVLDVEAAVRELVPAQYQPQVDAAARAVGPLRGFLQRHASARDRETFVGLATRMGRVVQGDELWVLAPAFVTSELRAAFAIAVLIFVPFLVIDLVVGLGLAALGLASTSPQAIALPLKLLLFVAVDGWRLLIDALLRGYV